MYPDRFVGRKTPLHLLSPDLVSFIVSFVCLWFTRSLSGILGFGISFFYLVFHLRKEILGRWILGIILLTTALAGLNFNYLKNRISDALVISTDPQNYSISDPGLIRLGLWKGSINLAFSSPKTFLIGTGPETFTYEFPFHRPDFLNYSSEW